MCFPTLHNMVFPTHHLENQETVSSKQKRYSLLSVQVSNNKATLFANFHATAIVGMCAVYPKGCKTESTNMFLSQSKSQAQPRNTCFHRGLASHLSLKRHVIQQSDSILSKIFHASSIITKIDSILSPEVAPASAFLLSCFYQNIQTQPMQAKITLCNKFSV